MIIYTDGSCIKNENGGWCFIIVNDSEDIICYGNEEKTTNNRMELTAIIEALVYITTEHPKCKKCLFKTDSQLTMNCASGKWKRNKNLDLWNIFNEYSKNITITWEWVKAHNGNHYNELADKYARSVAENLL